VRVLVVGAGLAGLSAAEVLLNAGADVTVIEAGNRPGGRTRTVRDRFRHGQVADSGAEWVDSIHWRYRELMARFGVVDEGDPAPWTTIRRWMFWDGRQVSGRDLDRLEAGLFTAVERYEETTDAPAATLIDPSRPDLHPDATFLDSRSLADVIAESDLGPAGRLLATRNAQGEFAAEPRQVSCLFVAQQRAHEREEARRQGIEVTANRVAGGTGQIAEALARESSGRFPDRFTILFGHRLTSVEQDIDAVTAVVRSSDGETSITADHVVLACSLVPLRNVTFRNTLPPLLAKAISSLGYGSITKTAVQFERREWVSGYGTTDSVSQRIYETTVDQVGDSGILMAYCGGDGGARLADVSEEERIALITEDMRRVHSLSATSIGAFSRSWSAHPNYGGAYAVYEPGQVTKYWRVLREPWGRVHLAGEHVATCTGYMEGAIESGRDVAERITS
jgi:monoamine oxidase